MQTVKEEIAVKNDKFIESDGIFLNEATNFRRKSIEEIDFIYDRHSRINMYLSEVKIMIITANQMERDSLFSYFSRQSCHHIIKIAKGNIVYSFFKIGDNKVVHVEPVNIGSYTHGGATTTISEALKVVRPSIIISLGVAYGANY